MRRICDFLVYLVVRLAVCLVQSLPYETCVYLSKGLASVFAGTFKIRRKLLRKNLKIAFPDWSEEQIRRAIHEAWEHLFLLVIEVAHTPRKIHDTNWRYHIRLVGAEKLVAFLNEEDRPVVLVTGHFGNFEVGGYILGLLGYPTYAVARTLDNPYLDKFIRRFREATGQYLIAKRGASEEIVAAMNRRDVVAFLADQADITRKGVPCQFFGQTASTFKAIAIVALQYKAAITVCYATRCGTNRPLQFELHITDVVDLNTDIPEAANPKVLTQWHVTKLEEAIRTQPNQYWWVHDRWKTTGLRQRDVRKDDDTNV